MQRRRLGIALVVSIAASAAFAQQPQPKLKPLAGSRAGYTSWARSELATSEDVRLRLTKFEKRYAGGDYSYISECPGSSGVPGELSEKSSSSFCYGSFHENLDFKDYDTGFFFYYDIDMPAAGGGWMPSGYYVDGAVKVPMIGEPKLECTIRLAGSTAAAQGAPVRCETSFTDSGNDSRPHWKVVANPQKVIDASVSSNAPQVAQLIADNCKLFDTPQCYWTRTQTSSAFMQEQKDWQSLTNWADSCPPTDPNRPFVLSSNRNVQVTWSDKVGGKISGKVGGDVLVVKVEATLEANYEHAVGQTDSYGEGYQYTIPYGYRSALFLQHGFLQVGGDFSIVTGGGERYLLKNAVFQFPLQKEVQPGGRGQPVARGYVQHVDVPCKQKAPADGAPPPRRAKLGVVKPPQ
ncbi:MAG TPA: hypothetical protein VF824_22490 [Thermoanaerobaculia bacterium]|jgi:hypothetical protein